MAIYFGPWQDGLVHEARLHPDCSAGYVPYSVPGADQNGNPVGQTYGGKRNVLKTDNTATFTPLKGIEIISGGALPMLFLVGPQGPDGGLYRGSSKALETRVDPPAISENDGSRVKDPGYYTVEPSATALAKAKVGLSNAYGDIPGIGVGYVHYGRRWPDYDDGPFSNDGTHQEEWDIFWEMHELISDLHFRSPLDNTYSGAGSPYEGSIGCVPPKAEWPVDATGVQIDETWLSSGAATIGREFLELRYEGHQAEIPVVGAYKQIGELDTTLVGYKSVLSPSDILSRPRLYSSMDIPAAAMTDWREAGKEAISGATSSSFDNWTSRGFRCVWAPVPPAPIMTPFIYRPRTYFGAMDPPLPPEGDNVVQFGITGTINTSPAALAYTYFPNVQYGDHYELKSLTWSIYVKFRTPRWRYTYPEEPAITGEPNGARRRFT